MWPINVGGFIKKLVVHIFYWLGSILYHAALTVISYVGTGLENGLSTLLANTGILSSLHAQSVPAQASNIGTVANYMLGCLCIQPIFLTGLLAVIFAACGAVVIRGIFKIWSVIWAGN